MKQIGTLVRDIYSVLDNGAEATPEETKSFGESLGQLLTDRLIEDRQRPPTLRMSNLGEPCDRKQWLTINRPDTSEVLSPQTRLKFLYGDILEALLLFLARLSGHKVEGEQDTLAIGSVVGHRDAVIDGVTVDVKSASARSFDKFQYGLREDNDAFNYLDQMGGYVYAGQNDPLVTDKEHGAFLVAEKTSGAVTLDIHKRKDKDYEDLVRRKQEMLASPELPPRYYQDVPFGASGNRKLGVNCSYCPVKHSCWPGLRGFRYSSGPVFLTKVVRLPDVPEVK